jgi:hypothetical protein
VAAAILGSAGELAAQEPSRRRFVLPTARVDLGALWLLSPARTSGFTAHVTGGAAIGWPGPGLERLFTPSLWLFPELSYDYRDALARDSHTVSLGLGAGWGNLLWINGGYVARFTAGVAAGEAAVGMRHGLFARCFGMLLNLELSHQLLSAGGEVGHELQLTVGLNLGSLALFTM